MVIDHLSESVEERFSIVRSWARLRMELHGKARPTKNIEAFDRLVVCIDVSYFNIVAMEVFTFR